MYTDYGIESKHTFGRFLKYKYWENAKKLIDLQISGRKSGDNLYKSLEMYLYDDIYEQISSKMGKEYFNNKIANGFFYGLENEFYCYQYPIPKEIVGVRRLSFLSYPMAILYYSIGLYLLDLCSDFLSLNIKSNNKIKSFYGAKVMPENNCKLKNLNYLPFYKEFKRELNGPIFQSENTSVIRLDIENFYDNFPLFSFLNSIKDNLKDTKCKENIYDNITINDINYFFLFLSNNRTGIPQSKNNIISQLIANIYLNFVDLSVEDIIHEICEAKLLDYKIVRYIDDYYIILNYNTGDEHERAIYSTQLLLAFSDLFYNTYSLKLNSKCKIYNLDNDNEKKSLIYNFKKVSSGIEISSDQISKKKSDPQESLDNILSVISKLDITSAFYTKNENSDEDVLKEIYSKNVISIANKKENQLKIKEVFENFDFDLVCLRPKEIIVLICLCTDAETRFVNYLTKKENYTISDENLVLTYLCQTNFQNNDLIDKLCKYNKHYNTIIKEKNAVPDDNSCYFGLPLHKLHDISNNVKIINQIKKRVVNEKYQNFTIAINHLVNEFLEICKLYDKNSSNDYNAENVRDYLKRLNVDNKSIIFIDKMFDRRNTNSVSHSGSKEIIGTDIELEEYYNFKKAVARCLKKILSCHN